MHSVVAQWLHVASFVLLSGWDGEPSTGANVVIIYHLFRFGSFGSTTVVDGMGFGCEYSTGFIFRALFWDGEPKPSLEPMLDIVCRFGSFGSMTAVDGAGFGV